MAKRLKAMGQSNYAQGFELAIHENSFNLPLSWKKPQMIFVNSMSDLFHKDVPDDVILTLIRIMREADWHTFQILTKRSDRLQQLSARIDWPGNVWMGVSVENQETVHRIQHLVKTQARIKFLSLEPLLGPLPNLLLEDIDWVIVGGESGPRSRPIETQWVSEIRDQCLAAKAPFFFKQWGGINKKKTGRILDGRIWDEMPSEIAA